MTANTLTLQLDGQIPLDLFARAMVQFNGLLSALSDEIANDEPVEWQIERLQHGSALIGVRPFSSDIEAVDRLVRAYDEIGEALAHHEPLPFSPTVTSYAYGLTALLNGKITGLVLQTHFNSFTVTEPAKVAEGKEIGAAHRPAWGEMRGEVGAIIRRPRLQITIYDDLFDRGVPCYLDEAWQDQVSQFWSKRVAITGLVYRDEATNRPLKVREVVAVDVLRPSSGDFRRARGVIPWHMGDEPAEVTIRRLRNEPSEI